MTAPERRNHQDAMTAHRRRLIVEAAQSVFEAQGLENASIRTIAQAAGCTTGAIYPHFKGKEEVFAAVLGQSLDRLIAAVDKAVSESRDAPGAIRRGTVAFYDYYDKRPSELALALYLFNGIRPRRLGDGLDEGLTRQLEQVLRIFGEQISRASDSRFMPMVEVEATGLFTYLVGLLILRHNGRIKSFNKNVAVLLAHYTKNMMHRLAARRKANARGDRRSGRI